VSSSVSENYVEYNRKDLVDVTVSGREIRDNFRLDFKAANRTLANFTLEFIGTVSENPYLESFWDGYIGIAPYTSDPDVIKDNVMLALKNQGIIEHIVTSFFVTDEGVSSVKFGSMDASGIQEGETMSLYRTINQTTWRLSADNFEANGLLMQDIRPTSIPKSELSLEMSLPFMYFPDDHYFKWQQIIQLEFSN